MVVLYVSILILFVAINYMMAMRMQAVVEQKGHHNVRVGHCAYHHKRLLLRQYRVHIYRANILFGNIYCIH